ncbi:YoaK family protein [Candidatus Galacturonibacter soehngenii]|uniref:DUF1275 domain-containing protein n=1 Tax=Candidatus Galacturonatibacter soehngenii TaxID=2307010 RepID=A0A7V7QJB7_9FIRM|nr:YoaK family protein [Candidatus Galacturonibacter soehngenii]KAB1436562.1 DUF1275 domain-containing protein [Candidatus Galacturonibacter soehngenii]
MKQFKLIKKSDASDSLSLAIILTLSGGFMDSYSYMCRGEVFANAQTGNLLLFGVNLSTGNLLHAMRYLFPVLAFVFGIITAEIVRYKYSKQTNIHWRQITLVIEAFILLFVAFIPQDFNLLANSLTSFACGAQVQSFRTVNGSGIATTMCIGNLRCATQALCDYITSKEKTALKNSFFYFGIITVFIIGAIVGDFFVNIWAEKAILISSLLLLFGFVWMLVRKEN